MATNDPPVQYAQAGSPAMSLSPAQKKSLLTSLGWYLLAGIVTALGAWWGTHSEEINFGPSWAPILAVVPIVLGFAANWAQQFIPDNRSNRNSNSIK